MATAMLEGTTEAAPREIHHLVVLHLAGELYGADIACVHTVITPPPVTPVPRSARWVKGVINLRGRVLPLIDLRARLGLPPLAEGARSTARVVVMNTEGLSAGLVVDGVSEVVQVPVNAVTAPPSLGESAGDGCVTGIGRLSTGAGSDERLILLLDVPRLLAGSQEQAR